MSRIGILGGTFDPPHLGHLALARTALVQLELDEVLWMPAAQNPLKHERATDGKHRLAMIRRLIANESRMAVSDLELTRRGPSYMVDTLDEFQFVKPGEYWLLCGADILKTLPDWRKPDRIAKMCRLGIALRPPMTEENLHVSVPLPFRERYDLVRMAPTDVSASEIRDRLNRKKSTAGLLAPEIASYIQEHRLYA